MIWLLDYISYKYACFDSRLSRKRKASFSGFSVHILRLFRSSLQISLIDPPRTPTLKIKEILLFFAFGVLFLRPLQLKKFFCINFSKKNYMNYEKKKGKKAPPHPKLGNLHLVPPLKTVENPQNWMKKFPQRRIWDFKNPPAPLRVGIPGYTHLFFFFFWVYISVFINNLLDFIYLYIQETCKTFCTAVSPIFPVSLVQLCLRTLFTQWKSM